METATLAVDKNAAVEALREYKAHRGSYDSKDWEIERIYRAIAKGKKVISVQDSIVQAGLDEKGRPKLAICEAHAERCVCEFDGYQSSARVRFGVAQQASWGTWKGTGRVTVAWPGLQYKSSCVALLPRIPPQHRPSSVLMSHYYILWEAEWTDVPPRDPMLLRRIGKDAWVVLAAWELTDVEMNVLRARRAS